MTEDKIQAEIYKWFHNNYCLIKNKPKFCIFSVPNGGYRNKREAMKLKATGLLSGVSDLIVMLPNKVLFVEVKDAKGRQSPRQKMFERTVTALGFDYFLVRSLDDFKKILKKFNK